MGERKELYDFEDEEDFYDEGEDDDDDVEFNGPAYLEHEYPSDPYADDDTYGYWHTERTEDDYK